MATVKRFEDLEIWKVAREQANEIFKLTQTEKFSKDFSVRNQINNSSGSVMDCIAEGFERFSNKEFSQFLVIVKGSNGEVRSQLHRAFDRFYISEKILQTRLNFSIHLGNKIKSFIDYLQAPKFKSKPKAGDLEHPTSNINNES
jgi:four helix bundle protein